jgi:hypothetical protein
LPSGKIVCIEQIQNGLDNLILDFCHDIQFGDGLKGRIGLLGLGSVPA